MPVDDLARSDVVTADPETPVADLATTMADETVGSVVITDGDTPVGIVTQAFLAAHLLRWLGIGRSLAFVPVLALLGFLWLGLAPLLWVLVVFQVLYRTGRYAVARPPRWR